MGISYIYIMGISLGYNGNIMGYGYDGNIMGMNVVHTHDGSIMGI
jgi:hypothetical protein